jgi:hypothetical protein
MPAAAKVHAQPLFIKIRLATVGPLAHINDHGNPVGQQHLAERGDAVALVAKGKERLHQEVSDE